MATFQIPTFPIVCSSYEINVMTHRMRRWITIGLVVALYALQSCTEREKKALALRDDMIPDANAKVVSKFVVRGRGIVDVTIIEYNDSLHYMIATTSEGVAIERIP